MYLIVVHKYREFKIINYKEWIISNIEDKNKLIENNIILLDYLQTNAYKNKFFKKHMSMINKWEKVIFITYEKEYLKYTQDQNIINNIIDNNQTQNIYNNKNIKSKWIDFIFNNKIKTK